MITNAISVDLEEYYHAENVRTFFDSEAQSRVVESTNKVLELFDKFNIKATFFVLGQVAKKQPELIKQIAASGHEIASHGYNHKIVYQQTRDEFIQDITDSKKLLEDLTGKKIKGYRAPNFSITKNVSWAFEEIKNAGYEYDSSVYPVRHDRYSNVNLPRFPYKHNSGLIIIPLATYQLSGLRLPCAGGAYWRLLPEFYTNFCLKGLNKKEEKPAFCYFHPWELDVEQPVAKDISFLKKLRHYGNTKKFPEILGRVFSDFSFGRYDEVIAF